MDRADSKAVGGPAPTVNHGGGGPVQAVYAAANVSMEYGGTRALDDVSIAIHTGQVHALLGSNGAGKSTLVKILAGVQQPLGGELMLDGEKVSFSNCRQATEAGVAIVSQELNLFPDLTVLENLFLMREPLVAGVLARRSEMRSRAAPVLNEVGLSAALLGRPLRSLSLGARQLVEIARALLEEPRVLILDEPTSALKASETRRLLKVVRELRNRDVAVLFVTHFLEDVFEIADVVTVLRNGRVVEEATPCAELTPESVIAGMLGDAARRGGRKGVSAFPIPPAPKDLGPLVLTDASVRGVLEPLTMRAEPGEVVGLAGLEGSGASEALRMIFGQLQLSGGEVKLPTGGSAPRSMLAAVRAGISYVPADRKSDGLILQQPIYENVSMVTAGPLKRLGFLPRTRYKIGRVKEWQEPLGLVMSSAAIPVELMSGGNQQKVVFAKWLEPAPALVLLDDPTRGVDVGAKADMVNIIRAVADSGRVVLYTSTDLDEMSQICDRIIVFYRKAAVGELRPPLSEHQLVDATTTGLIRKSGQPAKLERSTGVGVPGEEPGGATAETS
jgi:ABC-type sugar transport system ATPase subunit